MNSRSDVRPEWCVRPPGWVASIVAKHPPPYADDEARMRLAVALSRGNLESGDGGPFGAGVFDEVTGELVAAGVNLALATGVTVAHAEIVALTLAQQALGVADLGARPGLTLVTSAEPCAMCLGAIPWSGIRRVVIGARDADIRAIGFDEGAKPAGWVEALNARGIEVTRDLCRDEAAAVLREYGERGGVVY